MLEFEFVGIVLADIEVNFIDFKKQQAGIFHEPSQAGGEREEGNPAGILLDLKTPRVHALAVLREALSNVAKHAAATSILVEIEVTTSELLLRVTDAR